MTRYFERNDIYHPYQEPTTREVSPDSAFRPFPDWMTDYHFHHTDIRLRSGHLLPRGQSIRIQTFWVDWYNANDCTFRICAKQIPQWGWDYDVHNWTVPERVAFRNFPYHAIKYLRENHRLEGPNSLTERFGDWFPVYDHEVPQYPYPPMPWTV